MTMHTYKVDNYGIFIPISQIKQATYDDLKTLEENGEIMMFERDDIEDIEIYPLTNIGDIDWYKPNEDTNAVVFIANNRTSLYSPAITCPNQSTLIFLPLLKNQMTSSSQRISSQMQF